MERPAVTYSLHYFTKNIHIFLYTSQRVKLGCCDDGRKLHPIIGGNVASCGSLVCSCISWCPCRYCSLLNRLIEEVNLNLINWETNKLQ